MDKRVIFAVAGAGKTTHIVENLSLQKRSLIITYTESNYANLQRKITKKFNNEWPSNITLMTYFTFLYRFCYKPFLADKVRAKGLIYEKNPNQGLKQTERRYYMTETRYLYSNRITLLFEKCNIIDEIKKRIETYFDEIIIDEIQDIGGRDFDFLEQLMSTNVNILFVGDFYQHTYDTSRDGNDNGSLFANQKRYEKRFSDKGVMVNHKSLQKSWRCSANICEYIRNNLGIEIYSQTDSTGTVEYVSDLQRINEILRDNGIVKLHFRNSAKYGLNHRNWGDTKGEDCYYDVCVLLNKSTAKNFAERTLQNLAPLTKNKLYVAITRAHNNVYFIDESYATML